MKRIRLIAICLFMAGFMTLSNSCNDGDPPELAASITSFSGTPQVISRSERTALRWNTENTLVFSLSETRTPVMPDADQDWICNRQGSSMACRAANVPTSAEGWNCNGTTCYRSISSDADDYREIPLGPQSTPLGSIDLYPDRTTIYKIEAEGNSGNVDMAWVQVVVADDPGARILYWTANPSPALVGERVVLTYATEGCDRSDEPSASPQLPWGEELVGADGNSPQAGTYIWEAATETRDFYFGCHPASETNNNDARVRSHITVPVIQLPQLCERIDTFSVSPSDTVAVGSEITVTWSVHNETGLQGDSDPEISAGDGGPFYIGSTRRSGSWTGTVNQTTDFTLEVFGECGGLLETITVTVE